MKKIKALLASLFCLTLAAGMMACGGSTTETSEEKPNSSVAESIVPEASETPATSEDPVASEEPSTSVEDPITSEETPVTSEEPETSVEDPITSEEPETSEEPGESVEPEVPAVYTITLDGKNGAEKKTVEVTYGAAYSFDNPTAVEGYTFAGWFYNGTKVEAAGAKWAMEENVTLTAVWSENTVEEGEYAAKFIVDKINYDENVVASFVTKKAYPAGSTVSFKYFVPENVTSSWFAVCGVADPTATNIYENWLYQGQPAKGVWQTITVTLTADSYIHFAGSALDWGAKDEPPTEGYILIDDFTVVSGDTTVVDNFNNGRTAGLFTVNDPLSVALGEGFVENPFEEGEYAVRLDFNTNFDINPKMFITKDAYPAGSKITFKFKIPEETVVGDWWSVNWAPTMQDAWFWAVSHERADSGVDGVSPSKDRGDNWVDFSFTLPADGSSYYIYFAANSATNNDPWTGYVYIDDFKVVTPEYETTTEDFNKPLEDCIFSIGGAAVTLSNKGEGAPAFESGEYAMKLMATAHDGKIPFVTKTNYAAGSTVSFKYYIPNGTTTNWWRLSYGPNKDNLDYYGSSYIDLSQQTGAWIDVSIKLPGPGAPLYLFIGNEEGHWTLNGGPAYILIDNFTITSEDGEILVFEDFNKALDESIFEVLRGTEVMLSAKGDGFVEGAEPPKPEEPEFQEGEYGVKLTVDKMSSDRTAPTFITKQAYKGGVTVTLDYYMSGNTLSKWWVLGWTNDPSVASIYAHVENNKENNNAIDLPTNVQDSWQKATVNLPEGEWYLYFAGAVGEWSGGYVIIDNVKVGDTVIDDFNKGINAFNVGASHKSSIELADGYKVAEGEFGAKIWMKKISGTATTPTFITKQKYSGGVSVTFKYYMTGNTNNHWWMFGWTNDAGVASIYAHVEDNKENNDGKDLPKVQDSWQTVKVDIPAGEWYFYFAGNKPDCDATFAVIIDDFQIGDSVKETFNKGIAESIFSVRASHAAGVEQVAGYVDAAAQKGNTMLGFSAAAIGGNEYIAMITDKAYAGAKEITFKGVWTGEAASARWGLSYTTDPSKFSYGDELSAINCYSPKLGVFKQDTGVVYTYKITFADGKFDVYAKADGATDFERIAGGDYVDGNNYFYVVVCPAVNGEGNAFYMDDFTITYGETTVTDSFNDSISTLFVESITKAPSGYGSAGMNFVESTITKE